MGPCQLPILATISPIPINSRGCDQVSLCPKDGSKIIYHADYFCCATDICNGVPRAAIGASGIALLTLLVLSTPLLLLFTIH